MAKRAGRVKSVTALEAGETTRPEAACLERIERAGLAGHGRRVVEAKPLLGTIGLRWLQRWCGAGLVRLG